jgi:putative hydrolase of the HAD superfamily
MHEPKGVISIDFWNTIVDTSSGGKNRRKARLAALREIAEKHLEELSIERIEEAKQKTAEHFDRIWLNDHRTPTTNELASHILEYLGIPASKKEKQYLTTKFEDSMWDGPPELTDGVKEILPDLANRYPLAIISDTMYSPGRIIRKYLEERGLLDYFQCFVFSDETGYSKPNPKAYQKVLDETGSKARHSWHIGDLLETDITGAKKVGMQSILFTCVSDHSKKNGNPIEPDFVCSSWQDVAEIVL